MARQGTDRRNNSSSNQVVQSGPNQPAYVRMDVLRDLHLPDEVPPRWQRHGISLGRTIVAWTNPDTKRFPRSKGPVGTTVEAWVLQILRVEGPSVRPPTGGQEPARIFSPSMHTLQRTAAIYRRTPPYLNIFTARYRRLTLHKSVWPWDPVESHHTRAARHVKARVTILSSRLGRPRIADVCRDDVMRQFLSLVVNCSVWIMTLVGSPYVQTCRTLALGTR